MTYRILAGTLIALLTLAGSASAQDESPISINIGGGFTIPYSDLEDAFGTGGNFAFGVNYRFTPMFKVQAAYGFNGLGSKDLTTASNLPSGVITSIPLTANHSVHDFSVNLLVGPPLRNKRAVPYGLIGGGVFHQSVNVTTPAIGLGTVCNPWYYICYPTPVEVDQIIGERGHTGFGWNFGGGVTMRVTDRTKFYAEIKYIHVYGPSFTDATGVERTANGNYFPFTFGLRFHASD
jgi:opacity protein-like surface antigen